MRLVTKRFCAFLRNGDCLFRRGEKCRWEHDDAPCKDAVRRQLLLISKPEKKGKEKVQDPDLRTAKGRFAKHTQDVHGGIVYWACKRKSRYPNQNTANRAAKKMTVRFGVKMFVYYCRYCEGYHLTKKEQKA